MSNKSKIATISTVVGTASTCLYTYREVKERYSAKFKYNLRLSEDSFVYEEMMDFINSQATDAKEYRLISKRNKPVRKHYDGSAGVDVYIGGHKVKVCINTQNGGDLPEELVGMMGVKKDLLFTSYSKAGIQAVEKMVSDITQTKSMSEKKLHLFTTSNYGGWNAKGLPNKNIDSVILPTGVKESLLKDMENFHSSEAEFVELGFPWHRGYALYGSPGNGKSSIALALANHYKKHLYTLSLSMVSSDQSLQTLFDSIDPESIILIEDIDIIKSAVTRNAESDSVTLGGLLNVLDGVSTPHGLTTIITTNNFDELDPALVRPGRMDYVLELKAPSIDQIENSFERVFNEPLGGSPKSFSSMAELMDIFKRNMGDATAVRKEILDTVMQVG